MQDAELNAVLLKAGLLQRLRTPTQFTTERAASMPTASGQRVQQEVPQRLRSPKVPAEVLALVPRQGPRQLCLKFVSRQGCQLASPDRCVQSYLAHFDCPDLHPTMCEFVRQRYGRLSVKFEST